MTRLTITLLVAIVSAVGGPPLGSQTSSSPGTTAVHAQQPRRLLVRDVMVVYGTGKPPFGPMDVLVEDGLIAEVRSSARNSRDTADAVIDGRGKYLLPGFVNTHMHWHEERMPGVPQPIQYERNLYLASGVTTARELGGDFDKSKRWRAGERRPRDYRPANRPVHPAVGGRAAHSGGVTGQRAGGKGERR